MDTLARRYIRLAEKPFFNHQHLRKCAIEAFADETGHDIPEIAKLLWIGKIPWDMHQVKIDWSVRSVFKKGNNKNIARACVKELQNKKYEEYCQMFTDGWKSGTEVGLGVVCQELQIEAGLLAQSSVYSAEAAALAVAVQTADNRATVIFSDSASCMDAIKKEDSKHPFIQSTLKEASLKDITLCWIPGHSDIPGNEAADQAAERGRTAPPLHNVVPASDVIKWINKRLHDKFQRMWNDHRATFLQKIKPTVGKWIDHQDRQEQRALTRCRIGHTRLTKKHLFDRNQSATCEVCQMELTVEHIIVTCNKIR